MKLNYRRTFLIGFAFMAISVFWQMYDNIIPLILQNTFHLKEGAIGAIMEADNVLAVFLLPVIGAFSDLVDTRLGKRMPFIVGGTAAAVVSMMLLPVSDRLMSLPMFIIVLGVTLFAMGMYRSPAVALMPDLTPKPLRSKANAVINLMGAVGGVYSLLLIKLLVEKGTRPSYLWVFAGVAALMVLSVVLLLLTINEKRLARRLEEEYPEPAGTGGVSETDASEGSERSSDKREGVGGKAAVAAFGGPGASAERGVKRSLAFILMSIFLWFTAYNAVTTAFSRYAVTVWGLEGGGTASKLPSGDPGGLRGDRRGLGGDRCELSSHGGGDEQGQGRGTVYGPLLYIFHDGADCDADPLRSFAPVCLLPGHVSLCGGVQRGGLCDHALRKTRGQQARVEKVADRAL